MIRAVLRSLRKNFGEFEEYAKAEEYTWRQRYKCGITKVGCKIRCTPSLLPEKMCSLFLHLVEVKPEKSKK